LRERLDVAVEHRRVRAEPRAVRAPGDVQPLARRELLRIDLLVHALREDLGTSAREGPEAGGLEVLEDLFERLLEAVREEVVLGAGERLDVQGRSDLPDSAKQVRVEAVREVGVVAPDDVNLGDGLGEAFSDFLEALLERPGPAFVLLAIGPVEAAELAV